MTQATENLSWIKLRNETLFSFEKGGNLKEAPLFPWQALSELLKNTFNFVSCSLKLNGKQWISSEKIIDNLGKFFLIQPVSLVSVDNVEGFFLASENEIKEIMALILRDNEAASFFYDQEALMGFYYYFLAELCRLIQEVSWIPNFSIKLNKEVIKEHSILKKEEAYLVSDISCKINEKTFSFRILLSKENFEISKKFFSNLVIDLDINKINKTIPITFSIEIGKTSLSIEEWKTVKVGDFIFLDSCLYDFSSQESGGMLTLNGRFLFGGRFIDKGSFKIINYPSVEELSMNTENNENNENLEEGKNEQPDQKETVQKSNLTQTPITVVLEAGRCKVTIEEFLKLSPGSILDLGMHPKHGVNLVVNGSQIGKGELLSLGEAVGVRILEIQNG